MTTPVAVTQFVVKSHSSPDEVRSPDKSRIEIVRLEGFTLGRLSFEPGWRWSECIKPVAHTDSCQVSHVGYAVAGRVTVCRMTPRKPLSQGTSTPSHPATMPGSREMSRSWGSK